LRVRAWDRRGQLIDETVHGLRACTYQHECDHLDGRLFVDRADPTTFATWSEFDRHHRAAFVERARALVERLGS
jgi:peptide deformylase